MTLRALVGALALTLALAACGAPRAPTPPAAPTAAAPAPPAAPTAAAADATALVYRIVGGESQVRYEVGETFLSQGNRYATAVGITQAVSGEVRFDRAAPRRSSVGPISIDISTFASDNVRRDDAIRSRWLESTRFPLATFVPTAIDGLPARYTAGATIALTITGDLTIRAVTRPVAFQVVGRLVDTTMTGVATAQIAMRDFGFEPPSIAGVLRAEDEVRVELHFVARP